MSSRRSSRRAAARAAPPAAGDPKGIGADLDQLHVSGGSKSSNVNGATLQSDVSMHSDPFWVDALMATGGSSLEGSTMGGGAIAPDVLESSI